MTRKRSNLPILLVTRKLPDGIRKRIRRIIKGRMSLTVLDQGRDRIPRDGAGLVRVVCGWVPPDRLKELTDLRWLHIPWTGVDAILSSHGLPKGTILTCTKGHLSDGISEHILAGILHIARSFGPFSEASRRGLWMKRPEVSLVAGSSVLILGTGHIGRAAAQLLNSMGAKIFGLNSSGRPVPGFTRVFSRRRITGELKKMDFVVNTLPYTPVTDKFCDTAFFKALKKSAGFVNIGRGGTVDEAALVRAVESGRLKGAVLDVTRQEPLPKHSMLFYNPRILITAHTAAAPWKHEAEGLEVFCRNLGLYLAGKAGRMEFIVDPKKGY
jgi:phosphoglycerate dehydrogenase-like enzyme